MSNSKKRIALADRDLSILSLPSQDLPSYYDTPPSSPPRPPRPTLSSAYPTSLVRTTPSPTPSSSTGTLSISNRGRKLLPEAPFTNPLKLGHHQHQHQHDQPPLTLDNNVCLKKRKLNDTSSSSTRQGFLISPNFELIPRNFQTKDNNTDSQDVDEPFRNFKPLPPQSPLDLILLPFIQSTFSKKNQTFHLLSQSTQNLIEQEGELLKQLKRTVESLRGQGFEWRWQGDESRERERREKREEREKRQELQRRERESKRKEEKLKSRKERQERKLQQKLQREEQERLRRQEEDDAQAHEEEERRRQLAVQQGDVEMNTTTMPTPSSLPSLPLPPTTTTDEPVQEGSSADQVAVVEPQVEDSSSRQGESEATTAVTVSMMTIDSQATPPSELAKDDDQTRQEDPEQVSKEANPTTTTTTDEGETPTGKVAKVAKVEEEEEEKSNDEKNPVSIVTQPPPPPQEESATTTESTSLVEGEEEEREPSAEPTEPSIRRSGRQTRATVGLRASQLLYQDANTSNGRGISYSPDPYSISRGIDTTGGARNEEERLHQEEGGGAVDDEEESEQESEEEEELPLIPTEDIPEYASRLIDPETYVKNLFVSQDKEFIQLEKPGGQVETLSRNEQEMLVHDCLADLTRFLSDTLEYRNRLSEIRDGILQVERRRKGMWKVVRTVALDWLEEEAAGGAISGGPNAASATTGGGGVNGTAHANGGTGSVINGAGLHQGLYEGYE